MQIDSRILEVLLSNEQIVEISKKLAKEIDDKNYKNLVFIGLLKGCIPFFAELIKHVKTDHCQEFMVVSSYHGGTKSSGLAKIVMDVNSNVEGKDVIIIEDIIDTGRTLKKVKELLQARGANVVEICSLLDKPEGRTVEIEAEYVGHVIPNKFVVGFGLDYDEKLRNLPYIGVLKPEVYGGK